MNRIEMLDVNPKQLYLEESKKNYLLQKYHAGIEYRDELKYFEVEDAVVLPIKKYRLGERIYGNVGVLREDGTYVEASAVDNLYRGSYDAQVSEVSDKTAVYIGCDHNAWGHFLINVVPRLWILREEGIAVDEYVIVRELNKGSLGMSENESYFFRLLGIRDKVKVINKPVRYKKVIVPELSYHILEYIDKQTERGFYNKEYLQTMDLVTERALDCAKELPEKEKWHKVKKVFFGRACTVGKEQSLEIVYSFFRNNGYTILFPEKISLVEMIWYLHNCESVAYLSGTLQHNMLFAPKNRKVIAVERRSMLSVAQTDIDIMKQLDVVYVNMQYSILPGDRTGTAICAYTEQCQKYAEDFAMCPPDFYLTTEEHLQKGMENYLRYRLWDDAWNSKLPSPYHELCACVLEENLAELSKKLSFILPAEHAKLKDVSYWLHRFKELLEQFHIPYAKWDDRDERRFFTTVSSMIERKLGEGKREFLIFPYAKRGMMISQILKERYGIQTKAVFDTNISKYNPDVKKLSELPQYLTDDTCIFLSEASRECMYLLEEHCESEKIIGPFTIF